MAISYWERFSSRLKTSDEAREPFRHVLQQELRAEDPAQLLIYTPSNETVKAKSPASVLTLTARGWLLAAETEDGNATVARSDFAHTLRVELTDILLYGALRISFVADGGAQSVTIEFNTVMQRYYDEAVQLVLDGMDGIEAPPLVAPAEWEPLLEPLPLKFRNAFLNFTPRGERLLALVQWPAVFGARRRCLQKELAPEAALALTDRELLLVSEEKTWSWLRIGHPNKYGYIVTHCPLSRLEGYHVSESGPLANLDLALRAGGAVGDPVQIALPLEQKAVVRDIVLRGFALKAKPCVTTCNETHGQSDSNYPRTAS
jgi:hypothetical protein